MSEEKKKEFIHADEVWHRVVQIVQEGLLTGVDVTDLLRQIRVEGGPDGLLVLTRDYKQQVKDGHRRMLEDAERLKAERAQGRDQIPIVLGIIKDDPGAN